MTRTIVIVSSKMDVAESRFGDVPRVLGPKINKMPSYSLYSTNHILT